MTRQTRYEVVNRQLRAKGVTHPGSVYFNETVPQLYEEIIKRGEGRLGFGGVLVVNTGDYTGRSARDKFIVREESSRDHVAWGEVNIPFDEGDYEKLRQRLMAHLQGRELFVQDVWVGADPRYRRAARVVNTLAWQSLLVRNLLTPCRDGDFPEGEPEFTMIGAPSFKACPVVDGTRSEAFIVLHPGRREMLIGGTGYGGELKKAIFTMMNYLLPLQGVLPMHCSANVGDRGDTAIFFGLSGTGKTTLSTSVDRKMIGDDEHGWSEEGIFNFEGGCYAKVINLSPQAEPEIWQCTRKFGTVLENVVMDEMSRRVDLDDDSRTENTRAGYSLRALNNVQESGMGGHPRHVILLTADAFGVLPPVARLTHDQAIYHFLSGYTAKLAGTERGIKSPRATFSTCFGEPFMVHDPVVYANMLGERLSKTGARCWLVNTGWVGGAFGKGQRMPIHETRAIINQILADALNDGETRLDGVFNLAVPVAIDGVPPNRLNPRLAWGNEGAYDEAAHGLAGQFCEHFQKFASRVGAEVLACQPRRG